jgi:Transposase DDE domain group 1
LVGLILKGDFAVTVCTTKTIEFSSCKRRKVQAQFCGGEITSDGGVMLLREADRRLKLTERIAPLLPEPRVKSKVIHRMLPMLRQRVYALALGYEDLNDHGTLRSDPAIQTAVGRDEQLASSPTLCRFENWANGQSCWDISRELVEIFIESFSSPPSELTLDFDSTDDLVHGDQPGAVFHGYYDHECFLPLYVFCGDKLLAAYLRPGDVDSAHHAWGILSLLVKRLRQAWPQVHVILRGDSGFCRDRMLSWCERHGVSYIVGIGQNSRLNEMAAPWIELSEAGFELTGQKQRLFAELSYAARSWKQERRVIAKAEHTALGANPRYIVTNLPGEPQSLYEKTYCARGEMENRIKEQQLYLFADRTSCMNWLPNQLRLLLSSMAYCLLEAIRSLALKNTQLARARCDTIRLRLLKIGAVIIRNTRRVKFLLSSAYPLQSLFLEVSKRLAVA